jgi:hypothetical protein
MITGRALAHAWTLGSTKIPSERSVWMSSFAWWKAAAAPSLSSTAPRTIR